MGLRIVAGSDAPGPIPPPVLPDVGVAGVEHRWNALLAVTSAGGVTVTSWPDAALVSPLNLTRSVVSGETGAPEPQLVAPTGAPLYVQLAGIDMSSTTHLDPPHSYWVVFSSPPTGGKPIFRAIGVEVSRNSGTGRVRVQFGSSPVLNGDIHSNVDTWQSVIVAADPTGGSALMVNGVYQTPSGGTYTALGSGGANAPNHAMGDGAGGGTNVAKIRDHGSFAGLLSQAQMTTIYNALKAAYPDIV